MSGVGSCKWWVLILLGHLHPDWVLPRPLQVLGLKWKSPKLPEQERPWALVQLPWALVQLPWALWALVLENLGKLELQQDWGQDHNHPN
jgi:hypothetical protein